MAVFLFFFWALDSLDFLDLGTKAGAAVFSAGWVSLVVFLSGAGASSSSVGGERVTLGRAELLF